MDNSWLLDADEQQKAIEKLSIEERAEKLCLPDYLSIEEIVTIAIPLTALRPPRDPDKRREWFRENRPMKEQRKQLADKLVKACKEGEMNFEGNIKGWEYFQENPHPLAKKGHGELFIPDPSRNLHYAGGHDLGSPRPIKYECRPVDCTIHKHDFKCYLKVNGTWPAKGRLANWWNGDIEESGNHNKISGINKKRGDEILKVIARFKFDPLNVPYGGKVKVMRECLKNKSLFSSKSTFEKAWSALSVNEIIRIKDKEKYCPNKD